MSWSYKQGFQKNEMTQCFRFEGKEHGCINNGHVKLSSYEAVV